MKRLWKFLPFVIGGTFGYLLIKILDSGWSNNIGGVLAGLALFGLGLFLVLVLMVCIGIPAGADVNLSTEGVPTELLELAAAFNELGMQQIGPPVTVATRPPALLLGFVHPEEPVAGAIYKTGTVPPRIAFDFTSKIAGGGLTSGNQRDGGVMPQAPHQYVQTLHGGSPGALFTAHQQALAFLREQSYQTEYVPREAYIDKMREGMTRQRAFFLTRPFWHTWVMVTRLVLRRYPCAKPLARQEGIADRIANDLAQHPLPTPPST